MHPSSFLCCLVVLSSALFLSPIYSFPAFVVAPAVFSFFLFFCVLFILLLSALPFLRTLLNGLGSSLPVDDVRRAMTNLIAVITKVRTAYAP